MGEGYTVIEPGIQLVADKTRSGHFNLLRGCIAPTNTAGISLADYFGSLIPPLDRERSPSADVEIALPHFNTADPIPGN